MKYAGWYRAQNGAWRPVCEAPTEEECWRIVIQYKPPGVPYGEKCVLPGGEKP